MSDPTTSNKLFATPSRGSDSGVWDLPVNGNSNALDGILGGVAALSFTSATTVLLTVPSTGSVSAGAGPNQSENALLKFTGTLTGNIVVQFTLPGFYIVHNQCTVGSFFVQLQPAAGTGGGNAVGAPPGRKIHVFYDGTSMDYVNFSDPGTFLDMAVASTPAWMNACTVPPWLICDGSVYTSSVFPALNGYLGSTFGGNGITTFGVPDTLNRYRIPLDTKGVNRITSAVSGINGTTWGAAGGSQNYQQHNHGITDPGHTHNIGFGLSGEATPGPAASGGIQYVVPATVPTGNSTTNITINNNGTGTSGNIPPGLVFGMTFIKT